MDQNLCLFREWWERSGRPKSSLGPPPPSGFERLPTSDRHLGGRPRPAPLRHLPSRRAPGNDYFVYRAGKNKDEDAPSTPTSSSPTPRPAALAAPATCTFFHQLRTLTGAIRRPPLKLQERALTRSMYARVRAELAFAIGVRRPR
jgi:hypothetical protein